MKTNVNPNQDSGKKALSVLRLVETFWLVETFVSECSNFIKSN